MLARLGVLPVTYTADVSITFAVQLWPLGGIPASPLKVGRGAACWAPTTRSFPAPRRVGRQIPEGRLHLAMCRLRQEATPNRPGDRSARVAARDRLPTRVESQRRASPRSWRAFRRVDRRVRGPRRRGRGRAAGNPRVTAAAFAPN